MRILRRIGGFVMLVFIFTSCVKEATFYNEEIPTGDIILKKEVPQRVSDNMILEIKEISDFRCPIGSVCNESGRVCIDFQAYVNDELTDVNIDYTNGNCETTLSGHKIEVMQVEPQLFQGSETIDPRDYRITIKVVKLNQ